MAKPKRFVSLFLVAASLSILFLFSAFSKEQHPIDKGKPKEVNPLDFPVAEFEVALPKDARLRKMREGKGKKYNRRETAVDPNLITVSDRYHWDADMTSLPVRQSDAIVVGEVTSADAHLSSDKTGIYSEFTIQINQVLKNDSKNPVVFPGSVVAERTGGRIRFPSGQETLMYVSNLGVPQVGCKYVFFLTHDFPYDVRSEDFRILTGYQLVDGHVVPLESSGVVNFESHRGKDEQAFIRELEATIQREGVQ